jgi:uncharacterized repeat protein (TIGR01451 family)
MKKSTLFIFLLAPILLIAQTKKLPPVIEWQKTLGGSKVDRAKSVIPTADHGFLVVGLSFSNDGTVTGHHGTTDSSDAWIVKLNKSGDVEWQKSYGGSNTDEFTHAVQAGNGDFICVGTTRSTDGDVTGLHTSGKVASDVWVVRIDRNGAIKWNKAFGGSEEDHGQVIRSTPDGNYVIGGDAQSNDFDVSGNHGAADIWLLKINGQGNLLWQKTYGNANAQYVSSITVTSDNKYLISGYQEYKGYPAYQPGEYVLGVYEKAAVKTDAQGNSLWEQFPLFTTGPLGPSAFISRIFELPGGNLFSVGNAFNEYETLNPYWDFILLNSSNGSTLQEQNRLNIAIASYTYPRSAGPESAQLLSDGSVLSCLPVSNDVSPTPAALSRISSDLSQFSGFTYQQNYGRVTFNGVIALSDDEYIAAGYTNSGPTATNDDCWVVKFRGQNQIKGKVFIDNNGNGVYDAGDAYFTNGFVESKKSGTTTTSLLDATGGFVNFVDTGTYTTTVTLGAKSYYISTPASKQSTFTSYNNKDSFSFALTPAPGKNDLQLSLQALNTMRPGFEGQYRIDYSNEGTVTNANTVVKLVKPAAVAFQSAVPAPASVTADTITWNIGSLNSQSGGAINIVLKSNAPPAVNVGDVLVFTAVILPVAGDQTPLDNADTLHQTVRGSFDPNDKQENHNGVFYIDQVQAGQPLTYTVRFQNMGTDTAFNIVVRDTLSDNLDVSTLEVIGASHPFQFNLKDNRYCTWTFNDILLPDHNTNEPASHGYITYRIKPKNTLQSGDKIYNAASVYFDNNLPVQTNNQETVITPTPVPPPAQPIVSGMQLNYCGNQGAQQLKILNLPASTSGVTVTVKLDAAALTVASDSTVSFNVASLTGGSHNITVTFSNVTDTKTTTAAFTVTIAAVPDVNVTATITNITNLANPVVVTANNASGGGKSPLYTFSWNSSFTNIIQGESNSNTVTIPAASFALGDNKVYVKMKTSEDCYTAQTNSDSITILRDKVTGITDIDNPGQVINIYPNPFNGPITVNGLSPAKVYVIKIVNLQGQEVYSKQVTNQQTKELAPVKGGAGVYWLTIYDVKNKRQLGAVKLIKR